MYLVCCKILGIKPGSDVKTIKSAYRKAAKELHPDLNHFENAARYFIILQNAYKYLLEHPYTNTEIEYFKKAEALRQIINAKREQHAATLSKRNSLAEKSLQEIIMHSSKARIIFIIFHLLFLITGIYITYKSISDILFYKVDPFISSFSAYLSITFSFFFGILISIVIVFSGLHFLGRR